jgi:hypothetical protein
MLIQWSEEDRCLIVSLLDGENFSHTHGYSYKEAIKMVNN